MTEPTPAAPTRSFFLSRLGFLGWAIASVGLAAVSLVLFILTAVSLALIVVWAGIPMLYAVILATRQLAALNRRVAAKMLDRDIPAPYLQERGGNRLRRLWDLLADRASWRDLAWLAMNGTVGLAISIVGIVEGVLGLLFWWLPPGMMMRLHGYLAASLLAPTKGSTQAQRIQQLAETRADTQDASAAELRRIERDLHDGAQARLVAVGMTLGMAEQAMDDNPDQARQMVAEARADAIAALAELRNLVRGVHPPVLADRGLVPAITALALTYPIRIDVQSDLAERLPEPIETAAYFAVAEAVTNVAKHSAASAATVSVRRRPGRLELTVTDDGVGGADEGHGTGLAGIRRRLAAFDGTLDISSPIGGPTVIDIVIPVGSST